MAGPLPYTNNTPQSTDQISQTQPLIQQNFASIQTLLLQNHGDFTTSVAGQHNYVQMPVQAVAPAVTAGEVGLYNLLNVGVNEMFVRKSNGTSIPMTKSDLNLPGYTYLPSGIIIQWGLNTSGGVALTHVIYPLAFPTRTLIVNATPAVTNQIDKDSAVTVVCAGTGAPTTTGFDVMVNRRTSSSGQPQPNSQFYWVAIGY